MLEPSPPKAVRIWQVDAFTSRLFAGNPAAVCLLERWPEDELLQAVAMENALSETAFLVPKGEAFELRWLTPATEVALCGHATLAAAHVLATELGLGRGPMRFETRRAGTLTVEARGEGRYAMDFPAERVEPVPVPEGLAAALGASPLSFARTVEGGPSRTTKWLARLGSEAEVRALAPDFRRLLALPAGRFVVTARGDEVDFVSRYFAPAAGVDEDPVTGSAHCLLAPYWASELGRSALRARQVSRRGGELDCTVRGDRVELVGEAVLYLTGTIRLG